MLDNAKIDGILLSEIWNEVALLGGPMCSDVKIILCLSQVNLNFDEITDAIGIQPTKTTKLDGPEGFENGLMTKGWYSGSWCYIAFKKEEDDVLSIYEKTHEFAKIMAGKEEAIIMLKEKYKSGNILSVSLSIEGNPFINTTMFAISEDFIAFANKINSYIHFNTYRVKEDTTLS
ncbi:hypothetical protein FACS1894105_14020 [Clostridia bacterium]|nr:hypothetical protein FACS1894105_14020 [Clostridia bacterium]